MPYKFNPFTSNFDEVIDGSGFGDVTGPGSSTDDAVVRWDGITGTMIKNSNAILTDAGALTLASPLEVPSGGTGVVSLTAGGIVLGSGVAPVTVTAQPSDGQLLIGSTGVDPVLATLTAGTGISIAEGPGSITINASGGDVSGPGSSTDNALVRWDGATGTLIKNSVAILSDAGSLMGLTQITCDNLRLDGNTFSSTNANGNVVIAPNGTGNLDISSCGIIGNRRAVSSSDNVDANDWYIGVTSGTVTLTFDSGDFTTGQHFVIKDEAGAAGTNNITLASAGAETFDGSATYVINVDFGAVNVMFDGTDFFIF